MVIKSQDTPGVSFLTGGEETMFQSTIGRELSYQMSQKINVSFLTGGEETMFQSTIGRVLRHMLWTMFKHYFVRLKSMKL